MAPFAKDITPDSMVEGPGRRRRLRWRNPWAGSLYTLVTTLLGFGALFLILWSFMTKQLDNKGCEMSYMRPAYVRFEDFDTEHTRFASKYSLYLYREGGIDEDVRVKGVPVLFIPGNAGSYKQARSLASEAAYYYHNVFRHDVTANNAGKRPLDVFSVDFNEDITAFHGQTLLDQAEYLNDAISFILSLYHTPSRSLRDSHLPDPTSVVIVGHSMGGVVARTMLTMPNYQSNSINTIITLSAPHARPPVSFDGDIVRAYKGVNDYWRHAYSQKRAIDNPLWHVTLISIAGGGLDTIVSSDYSNLASLVPETHGFTVFTSSIPNAWTGADHLAITWCDQVRKSIIHAIYDVIDASNPTQTVSRAERMRGFKKWFLTGLEDIAEKTLPQLEPKTLLTVEEGSTSASHGEKLVLRSLGRTQQKPKAYLLPVPRQRSAEGKTFTFLTNEKLDFPGENGKLEVFFCSVFPLQAGQSATIFQMNMDLSGDSSGSTRLACKSAAADVIALPASTQHSLFPSQTDQQPFSYLQYDLKDLLEHQFVAIVDKASEQSSGWVVAEFSTTAESVYQVKTMVQRLINADLKLQLPAKRPLVAEFRIPALRSSLLAYKLHVGSRACGKDELFKPLLRQYITDVYESKFFVNVKDANINLHGVAPYMPPGFFARQPSNGLSLQLWMDPACKSSVDISLKIDYLGSLGKLWMRYRVVFATFPLFIVGIVLRQQFRVYDETGIFMSFAEGLNQCGRSSLPFALLGFQFLCSALARTRRHTSGSTQNWPLNMASGNATKWFSNTDHELLLGFDGDSHWFLIMFFGFICFAICVAVNYVALVIIYVFAMLNSLFSSSTSPTNNGRTPSFAVTSTGQRIITACILLSLVSTVAPYHFAYIVLCIVQIATCVRGYRLAKETRLDTSYNFYNYSHSIFILMLWILPINLPVLVVWVRNLMLHWLTPFSSHHNILSIMPFILLVEILSTGRMIPRAQPRFSILTNLLLFSIAMYAAMYGVTYAYVLHHLSNILCAWLVAIHFDVSSLSVKKISNMLEAMNPGSNMKKRP